MSSNKEVYIRAGEKSIFGHYGQIMTTKKTIIRFIWDINAAISENTVILIYESLKGRTDYLRLYCVCSRLYYLSRLVYKGKNRVTKLSEEQYRSMIFDGRAETKEEVEDILLRCGGVSEISTDQVMRCLYIIEKLWCGSISCLHEQIYIPELAYAFDYVIRHKGEIPEPEYAGAEHLFPSNYKNYENLEGLAKDFEEIMGVWN